MVSSINARRLSGRLYFANRSAQVFLESVNGEDFRLVSELLVQVLNSPAEIQILQT